MWQGRSFAIISLALTGRSCWSTPFRHSTPALPRSPILRTRSPMSCALSAPAAPRGLARSSALASTAFCLRRRRPTISITRATTGWRRSCARSRRRRSRAPRELEFIDVIALAAIRATREAEIKTGGETLDAIIGVPEKGETIGGQAFDGVAEAAVFPGELPADPDDDLRGRGDRPARGRQRLAVRALPPAAHPARRARAADPARPGAPIPDRGSSRVSRRPPRPRAFRLDDRRDRGRRPARSLRA